MKKLLFTLTALLISFSAFAQRLEPTIDDFINPVLIFFTVVLAIMALRHAPFIKEIFIKEGEKESSDLVIEIAGLRFAKVNLGTDVDHPLGRHYNDNGEADAAIPKGWRRPTEADNVQLYEHTTRTPTERDGVKGLLFKDKETGAEMFMPCAGYTTPDGELKGVGEVGIYLSSTRCPGYAYYSYHLYFSYDGTVYPSNHASRSFGFSVRCVQE